MSNDCRAYVPDGCFFFTVVAHQRQRLFAKQSNVQRLREGSPPYYCKAPHTVQFVPCNGIRPGRIREHCARGRVGSNSILLDEQDGRRLAQQQGLKPMGVVGVLLLAKQCGLLPAIRPELDALRTDAGFWLGASVYQLALQKARESFWIGRHGPIVLHPLCSRVRTPGRRILRQRAGAIAGISDAQDDSRNVRCVVAHARTQSISQSVTAFLN